MLKLETMADLQRLITDEIQESITLDYKASASLGRANDQRKELIKDVSAFANSAGGQIIYGIEEINRRPVRIDEGINPAVLSRESIEQIIDSRVQPKIEGLIIHPIPLNGENCAYVIDIPAAITRAPHQALDNKYYKRQNFQSIPMEDYEIRDIFRRSSNPEPFATILFTNGRANIDVELAHGSDHSTPIEFVITIGNKSSQPAYYSIFNFYIDSRLIVEGNGQLELLGRLTLNNGNTVNRYIKKLAIPNAFPLFKELDFILCAPPFSFSVPNIMLDSGVNFSVGYDFRTPGHHVTQFGKLSLPLRVLEIQMQPPSVDR